jgi:hypothetical protein
VGSLRLWSRQLGHPPEKNHNHRDILACLGEGRQLFIMAIIANAPLDIVGPEVSCPNVVAPTLSLDGGAVLS